MTAKTLAQRQADYYKRQLSKGLKLIKVWVRLEDAEHLRKFARKLMGKP